MNNIFQFNKPSNEHIKAYSANSEERVELLKKLREVQNKKIEIPLIINGEEVRTNNIGEIHCPHNHSIVLATYHKAGEAETALAIKAAIDAKAVWTNIPFADKAKIMLRAADLITNEYRNLMNAATMLGQSKSAHQAEIDAICETADHLRFNAYFASLLDKEQPDSSQGEINYQEHCPLEGFVYAVSPFNFTSIASNVCAAPAMMGNTVVWKPSASAILSNYYLMKIFEEAGLPKGVINFIPGEEQLIDKIVLEHKDLAAVNFSGSTASFNTIWKQVALNVDKYRSYPKLIGECGGKNFIFIHNSANLLETATAVIRGGFEYQGQKSSAASRVYVSKSMWSKLKPALINMMNDVKVGDVSTFTNFVNAVIDEPAFDKIMSYIENAKESNECEVVIGGTGDKTKGYFIQPTILETACSDFVTMQEEIFGPVVTVYVYEDDKYEETLELCNETSKYGLTGSIFAADRQAIVKASEVLKYAAGNLFINDKPTGAVVNQQPYGGSRNSGTNAKSGSKQYLLNFVTPRVIKENLTPPRDFRYPYMEYIEYYL